MTFIINIRIGADEIILWLRKNGRAVEIPNDRLGRQIREIIEQQLGGRLVEEDAPVYWAINNGDRNIGAFGIPQTAAQYEIPISKIGSLYQQLVNV